MQLGSSLAPMAQLQWRDLGERAAEWLSGGGGFAPNYRGPGCTYHHSV